MFLLKNNDIFFLGFATVWDPEKYHYCFWHKQSNWYFNQMGFWFSCKDFATDSGWPLYLVCSKFSNEKSMHTKFRKDCPSKNHSFFIWKFGAIFLPQTVQYRYTFSSQLIGCLIYVHIALRIRLRKENSVNAFSAYILRSWNQAEPRTFVFASTLMLANIDS